MVADLIHLTRNLRRSPASAAAAIVTLSLTLGAGASIFAVVDAVLLTPPPFANPEALVTLAEAPIDDLAGQPRSVTYGTFEAWRERAGSLAALEAFDGTNLTLTGLGPAERLSATDATPGLLALLGVTPALGRRFDASDLGQQVAIVSHDFWYGKLAGDPAVIGRQIVLGGQAHTIVGVLPERFFFLDRTDVWRPFAVTPDRIVAAGTRVLVIARLDRNAPPAHLARALDDVSRRSAPPARVIATPVTAAAIARDATRTLALLAGAAGLAVLIAFTNFAGLLIVRGIDRRRELAVRSALGARRLEIAKQLLLEAEALVALGIVGGVMLALWMTPTVARIVLQQYGGLVSRDVAVNWRVMGLVSIGAFVCALICGSVPALVAARRNVVATLRRGATPPPQELWFRRAVVTGEVALAFVLLVSVTLLGRNLMNVLSVNPGFDARGVLALAVSLPSAKYGTGERVASFYSGLQSTLQERLGPRSVGIIDEMPLTHNRGRRVARAQGADAGTEAVVRMASSAYFEVMQIPMLAGRPFDSRDNPLVQPRIIVSASLAQRLFASDSPIGRRVRLAGTGDAEIVGVVGDVKLRALDDPVLPTVYLSELQVPSRSSIVVIRSARPDSDTIAAVREEVARLDSDLPVYGVRSMQEAFERSPGVPARRVLTATFTGFALLAIVLGAIGLFGVLAHDVACRRPELALRMALGAHPMRIVRATARQGAVLLGSGLAVGSLLSIWVARALGSTGFATSYLDVVSVAGPAALLVIVGAGAILPAARRAATTDPLIVLRSE